MSGERSELETSLERWRDKLRQLMGEQSQSEFAESLSTSERTIRRWLNEKPTPTLDHLQVVAQNYPYPLIDQLADLGFLPPEVIPWGVSRFPSSPALLLDKMRLAVDEITRSHPNHRDLSREVMVFREGEEFLGERHGRWRSVLFDVAAGKAYPHVAFHGAEFRLGFDSLGSKRPVWHEQEWNSLSLSRYKYSNEWIDRVISGDDVPIDVFRNTEVSKDAAWERLELRWRLSELSRLVNIQWYGEVGSLHRLLLDDPKDDQERHIALVRAYDSHYPDPVKSIIPPSVNNVGASRVIIVGPPWALTTFVSAVVAESFGWRSYRASELLRQMTARVSRSSLAGEGVASDFEVVFNAIAETSLLRHSIVSVSELGYLVGSDGELRDSAKRMLSADGTFVILLDGTEKSAKLYEQRQQDQLPKNAILSDSYRRNVADEVMPILREQLRESRGGNESWTDLTCDIDIPWWTESNRTGDGPFFADSIGDSIIRASYAIHYRLIHGKLPSKTRRSNFEVVEGSLLSKFVRSLRNDTLVSEVLTERRSKSTAKYHALVL